MKVVAENQAEFSLYVNGNEIKADPGQWWLDRQFAVFDISESIHPGANIISLHNRPFSIFSELEPLYLLGDFSLSSVEKGFIIGSGNTLDLGSWRQQGLPFYSSGVKYEREYRIESKEGHFLVALGSWHGTVAEVRVNGIQAGFIAFEPYELDVGDLLIEGSNRISVIVNGSLKNTLGPHHNNPPLGRAWPAAFQRGATGGFPSGSKYHTVDYGLFEEFKLIRY